MHWQGIFPGHLGLCHGVLSSDEEKTLRELPGPGRSYTRSVCSSQKLGSQGFPQRTPELKAPHVVPHAQRGVGAPDKI